MEKYSTDFGRSIVKAMQQLAGGATNRKDTAASAFSRRTTDTVIAAIENQIALIEAKLAVTGSGDTGETVDELSDKRNRLNEFLADYRSTADRHHHRLAQKAKSAPRPLWRRILGHLTSN